MPTRIKKQGPFQRPRSKTVKKRTGDAATTKKDYTSQKGSKKETGAKRIRDNKAPNRKKQAPASKVRNVKT